MPDTKPADRVYASCPRALGKMSVETTVVYVGRHCTQNELEAGRGWCCSLQVLRLYS